MTSVSARTRPEPEPPGEHGMVTSITVPLSADVADDLRRLQECTRLSVTDLTNRAITSYEFLEACLHAGHDLIIRDVRTGETGLVQFSWRDPEVRTR